jgi:hypothetical protein
MFATSGSVDRYQSQLKPIFYLLVSLPKLFVDAGLLNFIVLHTTSDTSKYFAYLFSKSFSWACQAPEGSGETTSSALVARCSQVSRPRITICAFVTA